MIPARFDLSASRGTGSAALLCALAGEHGLSPRALLAGTGISEQALTDPTAEISAGQELQLIEALAPELPPHAGLAAGARYRLTTYGIWGFALLSSRTIREGHQVGMRFVGLSYALTSVSAHEDSGELVLRFDDLDLPEPARTFVLLRDASAALQIWRETLGQAVVPSRVELRMPEPADATPYETAFGVRPAFGSPTTTVGFDTELLDHPLPQADPLTAALCEAQCRELLGRRRSWRRTSGQVRDLLLHEPWRMPGQAEVASELHMSVRTLRRRLNEEGTGYREVVEQTREHLAEELLVTAGLTVEQVAQRLGYAEAASFVHAFRRWKGVSPRRWARSTVASRA